MSTESAPKVSDRIIDSIRTVGRRAPGSKHFRGTYNWIVRKFRSPVDVTVGGVTARFVTGQIVFEVEKEIDRLEEVLNAIGPDDVFYDIGANVGLYTCIVSHKLSGGSVYAFEPAPAVYQLLEQNVASNVGRSVAPVRLNNTALSDEEKTTAFAVDCGDNLSRRSSLVTNPFETESRPYELYRVKTVRGDSIAEEQEGSSPDVIKIDVEGAEYDVLKGFGNVLPDIRTVFCEMHPATLPCFDSTVEDIIRLLENEGFEVEYREDDRFLRADRLT